MCGDELLARESHHEPSEEFEIGDVVTLKSGRIEFLDGSEHIPGKRLRVCDMSIGYFNCFRSYYQRIFSI